MPECPVCLEECPSALQTPCGHSFCEDCLRNIDCKNTTPHCPMCRAELPREFLSQLWCYSHICALDTKFIGRVPHNMPPVRGRRSFPTWTEIQVSSVTVVMLHETHLVRTRADKQVLNGLVGDSMVVTRLPVACADGGVQLTRLILPRNLQIMLYTSNCDFLADLCQTAVNPNSLDVIGCGVSRAVSFYVCHGLPPLSRALVLLTDAFVLKAPEPGHFRLEPRPGHLTLAQ
jgi:hypothetical protein